MSNFNKSLTFDIQNAYESAYDLRVKKSYSSPKIYTANGDLKKRWYVYFSFRNPKTGRLKRVTPFYGDVHKYKTKEDRLFVLSVYRKKILELLKKGYNPFEKNAELFQKEKVSTIKSKEGVEKKSEVTKSDKNVAEVSQAIVSNSKSISEAFEFALNLKKKLVNEVTLKAYKSRSNSLLQFVEKNYPDVKYIDQLTKRMVVQFLNSILDKSSPRTRNNFRIEISSLMQVLEENEIVPTNFVKNIPVLKTAPERHKTYSKQLDVDIFNYLEDKDPILLLYIKFISYNYLRPIEVNRIKVGDMNLKERTISFKAKNKPLKTKIIPDILLNDIPDLSELDPEAFLFTPEKFGEKWATSENNKRDYFFLKISFGGR